MPDVFDTGSGFEGDLTRSTDTGPEGGAVESFSIAVSIIRSDSATSTEQGSVPTSSSKNVSDSATGVDHGTTGTGILRSGTDSALGAEGDLIQDIYDAPIEGSSSEAGYVLGADPEPPPDPLPSILVPFTEELMPRWRFVLVRSKDMKRIDILHQATNLKVELGLNLPGRAEFTYPMQGDHADLIAPYKTGIIAERFNWRATLARKNAGNYGEVWDKIWSGYVLPINDNFSDDKMTVSCVGWLQRLGKRVLRKDYIANSPTDDSLIIFNLLQAIDGYPTAPYEFASGTTSFIADDGYQIRWPNGSSPNTSTWLKWGGPLPNEGAGGATAYVSAPRQVNIAKYSQVLPEIERLVNIENGCDITVHPVTRVLNVYRRYRRIKNNVFLGFKWGPNNMATMNRQLDAEQMVNYFLARGELGTTPQYMDDTTSMDEVGPLEEVVNLSGVKNNNVLLAYAGAEIIVRSNGHITYGITPFAYTPENSVPEPLIDYRIGDQIRFTADGGKRGKIVNQAVRVFGMTFEVTESGTERLSQLQLSP